VTSALDPELVGEVLEAVKELKEEVGVTMLIATHEMGFAREVADRIAFLYEGRILEMGTPSEVLDSPSNAETRQFLRRLSVAT
jgi:polar amino acid transport system ATP-binding protein